MDPDVIEIAPPVSRANKQNKLKQVILREVIDVDNDEDSPDVMILDEKVDTKDKGIAVEDSSEGYYQATDGLVSYLFCPSENSAPGSHKTINIDGGSDLLYDSDYMDFISDDSMDFDDHAFLDAHFYDVDIPPGVEAPVPWILDPAHNLQRKKIPVTSSSSNNYSSVNQSPKATIPHGVEPSHWGHYTPFNLNNQDGTNNLICPNFPANVDGLNHHSVVGPSISWFTSKFKSSNTNHTSHSDFYDPFHAAYIPPEEGVTRTPKNVDENDILGKYQLFKKFDTVEDHSDHRYVSKGSSTKQPPKNWSKRVQEEWKILENDLPDTIFVRVYESRMDLLRAVIIGAESTPYHDGLFFFDVFFPSGYPNVPPLVYYHSGGLQLNPNLYSSGKVCLSLLGTWHGNKNEKWLPGVSTVLQVLVSIQALILNQKPFFNEPGYEYLSGSPNGEIKSQQYNEKTFMLSLKTMVYAMRRPPKHFEDFVMGHFHKYANDILVACKAYADGAQVGCLVKGGVQDVDEGDKGCSKGFKDSLPGCVDLLLKEFSLIGVKNTEEFQLWPK
ncbi:hypothetical protein P3X46_027016 [Hevea brasiliensis]|uniref:UBC core domain-containing protein n=1 Tax=Hevea brasiliensis TaxID=3981 RepID=A0ABQ9KYI6_HEVBR|nr:hypothetical protein P3X46_027016 [Hevea brasiliensis]